MAIGYLSRYAIFLLSFGRHPRSSDVKLHLKFLYKTGRYSDTICLPSFVSSRSVDGLVNDRTLLSSWFDFAIHKHAGAHIYIYPNMNTLPSPFGHLIQAQWLARWSYRPLLRRSNLTLYNVAFVLKSKRIIANFTVSHH